MEKSLLFASYLSLAILLTFGAVALLKNLFKN